MSAALTYILLVLFADPVNLSCGVSDEDSGSMSEHWDDFEKEDEMGVPAEDPDDPGHIGTLPDDPGHMGTLPDDPGDPGDITFTELQQSIVDEAGFSQDVAADGKSTLYKCNECNYSNPVKFYVKQHLITHSKDRPFKCPDCAYKGKRMSDLRKHLLIIHKKQVLKPNKRPYKIKLPTRKHTSPSSSQVSPKQVTHRLLSGQYGSDSQSYQSSQYTDQGKLTVSNVYSQPGRGMELSSSTNVAANPMPYSYSYSTTSSINSSPIQNLLNRPPGGVTSTPLNRGSPTVSSAIRSSAQFRLSPQTSNEMSQSVYPVTAARLASSTIMPSPSPPGESPTHYTSSARSSTSSYASPSSSSPSTIRQRFIWQTPAYEKPKISEPVYVIPDDEATSTEPMLSKKHDAATSTVKSFHCSHCNILFFDNAVYLMHMGLHSANHPWECSLCGGQYHDVYGFTSHLVNNHR